MKIVSKHTKLSVLIISSILLQFATTTVCASIDNAFIKYLATNDKHAELQYYLQTNCSNDVAGNYQWAKYYLLTKQDSLFAKHYKKAKKIFGADTMAMGFASCYFLQKNVKDKYAAWWFTEVDKRDAKAIQDIQFIYNIQLLQAKKIDPNIYPNVLQEAVLRYKKTASVSATKAAILSAIIPGAGNLYAGQKNIALQTFGSTIFFASSAAESVVKTKVHSALSIFTMALGGLFYGSNVYGAYRDVQYFKTEHLQQLYLDAYNYYSTAYYPTLY